MKIYANGKTWNGSEISKFVIYGHGVKLFERENDLQGFEQCENKNGSKILSEVYHSSPVAVFLAGEIKAARKENLNRKDNYTLTYSPEYLKWEKRTALYIHESEISVEDLGELLAMESEDEKCYLHAVRLHFKNAVKFERLHAEHIQCGGDWRLPEGGKWSSAYGTIEKPCFDTYDYTNSPFEKSREKGKGVIKRWITSETVDNAEIISAFHKYSRIEYSEDRKRRVRIAEKLKAANLDLAYWQIEKLEKVLGVKLEG